MHFPIVFLLMLVVFNVPARAEDSRVVATIKPIHALVAGVMGKTGEPALLVKGTASPHGYAMKPSQRKVLEEAHLVFIIDPQFETFLTRVTDDLPDHVRVVPLAHADGVTVLNVRNGGVWGAHLHSTHHHREKKTDQHHDHDAHTTSRSDLHIWLDPQNAIAITTAIARELGKAYPEHRRVYQENASAQIAELHALDAELATLVRPLQHKPFIVFHDAYQYFERRYGLTAVGSITLEPEQNISARRVQDIRRKLKEANVICVFREPQFDDTLIAAVIEGSMVKSGTLDPLGAATDAGASLYPAMLRNLARDLTGCLAR